MSSEKPYIRAHRWVWMNYYGPIPKGYHVHHIDEDKTNNSIDNLSLMKHQDHARFHMQDPARLEKTKEIASKCVHKMIAWRKSEVGIAWATDPKTQEQRKLIGKKSWEGRLPVIRHCKQCSKEISSRSPRGKSVCGKVCDNKWRRLNGVDGIEKKCEYCSKPFMASKWINTKCCSPSCATTKRWEEGRFKKQKIA